MSAGSLDALFVPAGTALLKNSPWTLFDRAWTSIVGYPAVDFRFVPGKTPMATMKETLLMISLYYIVIYTGWEFMRKRQPLKLHMLFMAHNFILTALSGALLVLFLEQIIPSLWKQGLYNCICTDVGWSDQLVTLYYLNYLTKYIEFLDTAFLFLKKKPLTFLHTYHHGATAFLCYTQLVGRTPVSWVPITLNLTVHVIMYWYYFQSARGIRVWWKEWITRLQILQFVLDLGFIYFATWDYYASVFDTLNLPHIGRCRGEPLAALTGCVILSSYLVLFVSFYIATYKKSGSKGRKIIGAKAGTKERPFANTTSRTTETLKTARSKIGSASIDIVESGSKGQWSASAIQSKTE